MNFLSNDYEVHYQGSNYLGQILPPHGIKFQDGSELKFWLHGRGREDYCRDLILPRIQRLQPDFFTCLLDSFMLYPWILDMNFSPAHSILYVPSDGTGGYPNGCELVLKHFNTVVAMSKFAQKQAKDYYNLDLLYIPHSIDINAFFPLSDFEKNKLKQNLVVMTVSGTFVKGLLKDRFIVGIVGRNQGRKMHDRAIKAFSLFCKDKPDALLYVHLDIYDSAAVFDIRQLIKRLNIENRVVFSPIRYFENIERNIMNEIYNLQDIYLSSSSGEGFGICTIEAMACKIPVVITDFTTTQELIMENGQCGISVPIVEVEKSSYDNMHNFLEIDKVFDKGTITGSWTVERGIMSIPKCVEALNILYCDPGLRRDFGETGREKVIKFYSNLVVHPQWKELLQKIKS